MSATRYKTTAHVFPGQHIRQYPGANRNREEDVQYLEVKQYTPLRYGEPQEGDITIIGTGAVSFPKEMYEPFYDELLTQFESHGLRIRSIWSVDKSDHGASGVLNEHTQGDDPSSSDLSRDLLNMVNMYRDQMTLPIVGIGHSMGATALFELSLIHPRLFASLVVIDPVVGAASLKSGALLIYASSRRPDLWNSRKEAEQAFRSAKALKTWDPRVMNLWLEHGLRATPTLLYPEPGRMTLRTTKANEAWTYGRSWFDPLPGNNSYVSEQGRIKYPDGDESILDTYPFYCPEANYVWDALPQIQVPVFYIFPDSSPMSTPDIMVKKIEQTGSGNRGSGGEKAGMTSKSVINGCGHLVAFEKPGECAENAVGWLAKSLKTWEERKKYERENRDNKSMNQVALSGEWIKRAKEGFDAFMARPKTKL